MLGLSPLETTAVYALLLLVVSALSGLLGYRLLHTDEDLLTYLNAISTGVILGAAFTHLLPDAMNALKGYSDYPIAAACSLGGFLMLIIVETCMQDLNFEEEHKEAEIAHHAHDCADHEYAAGADDVHPELGTLQSSAIVQLRRRNSVQGQQQQQSVLMMGGRGGGGRSSFSGFGDAKPMPLKVRSQSVCNRTESLIAQRAAALTTRSYTQTYPTSSTSANSSAINTSNKNGGSDDAAKFGYGSFASASVNPIAASNSPNSNNNTSTYYGNGTSPGTSNLLVKRLSGASESELSFATAQDASPMPAASSSIKSPSSHVSGLFPSIANSPKNTSTNTGMVAVSPLTPDHGHDHVHYASTTNTTTCTSTSTKDVERGISSDSYHHDHHDHDHDHHSHEYDDLIKRHSFARSDCDEVASLKSFTEDVSQHAVHGHNHGHSHGHGGGGADGGNMRSSSIIAFWGALMVHSTVEGLGIGVTADVEQFAIVFAILIHKVFESLALSGTLFDSKLCWTMKLVLFGSFCLSIPTGAVVGAVLKSNDAGNSLFSGIITGVASGSFMYIGTMEMLPHTLQSCKNIRVGMALFVSAALAMAALAAVV